MKAKTLAIVNNGDGTYTAYAHDKAQQTIYVERIDVVLVQDDGYGDLYAESLGLEPWGDLPSKVRKAIKEAGL